MTLPDPIDLQTRIENQPFSILDHRLLVLVLILLLLQLIQSIGYG